MSIGVARPPCTPLGAGSGGLEVLRAPGKKQYAGPFQQCWKKGQILLYGSVV